MPRQILTIELDGVTAGDYIAHASDPEPPALGDGLRSMTLRAEPRGHTVEAILTWDDCVPAPRVAAQAAACPSSPRSPPSTPASCTRSPASRSPAQATRPAPAPGRVSARFDRAAGRLAAQAHMVPAQPLVLRWA